MSVEDTSSITAARAHRLLSRARLVLDAGSGADGMGYLKRAVAMAPGDLEVLRTAGMLAYRTKNHPEPIAWLHRARVGEPYAVRTRVGLGLALAEYGRMERAVAELQRARAFAPDAIAVLHALGEVARLAGWPQVAMEATCAALTREPGSSSALLTRAGIEASIGSIDAAAATLRALLRGNRNFWPAWIALADLKTVALTQSECGLLAQAFAVVGRDASARAQIGFALGKGLEDQGEYARAFDVLDTANKLRRSQVQWDAGALRSMTDAIIQAAGTDTIRGEDALLGRGVTLLASMPRSGSSLVAQILGAHPAVFSAGEVDHLMRVVDTESRKRGAAFPAWIPATSAQRWSRLGRQYMGWWGGPGASNAGFVDKGMTNWLVLGVALKMLPNARVVICRRNPLETCLGCYRQYFTQGSAFTYSLEELVDYYAEFDRLTAFWQQLFPSQVFTLQYESLVTDPEPVIRGLLQFCGLSFNPQCLAPHLSRRVVLSAPSAAQVRQPIRTGTARAPRYGAKLDRLRALLDSRGLNGGPQARNVNGVSTK